MANTPMNVEFVSGGARRSGQATTRMAVLDSSGASRTVPLQAAAQTDVGAVTSTVAAGATPTKAEFDALRVDALATRTVLNSLLAKMRTAEQLAP